MKHFNWEYYQYLNPDLFWLGIQTPKDLHDHYVKFCRKENRKSTFNDIYPNFNWLEYKNLNPHLLFLTKEQYEHHYFTIGKHENLPTNKKELLDLIDLSRFKKEYPALEDIGIESLEDIEKYYINIERFNPEFKKNITKPILGFFLIGFGQPFIEKKIEILKNNLEVLKKIKEIYEIDLYIFNYSIDCSILNTIDFKQYVSNVYIRDEKGILGEFIYNYVSFQYKKYDYMGLFLDDIEFYKEFDIKKVIKVYELERLDILGFPLTRDSPTNHEFMYTMNDPEYNYRETNFIEMFFYFISNRNFPKYLQFFNKLTKWCWGIDIALHDKGIKMGMLECYPIKHYFKAKSYNPNLPSPIDEWSRIKNSCKTIKNKIILKKEKY